MDKHMFRATSPAGRFDPLHAAALRASKIILAFGLVAAMLFVTGCAENKQRMYEEDLNRMAHWLPGTYDNTQQAKSDVQKGVHPPHDAVELAIVPLDSVSVGRNAFYAQETVADDPRRVLSQRVLIFKVTEKGIVESISSLEDPLRWRDGQRQADIFMGMTPKDLKPATGCDLTWKRETQPDKAAKKLSKEEAERAASKMRFIGSNDPKKCEETSHIVMGLVSVELRAELTMNEFATAELQYDSNGQLLSPNKDEPFYRFHKTATGQRAPLDSRELLEK
jgi:hypothetical protein